MTGTPSQKIPTFVRGDLDGFFGLFIDNLLQLMLIHVLCRYVCGFPEELVTGKILPASAISILVGNFYYSWQARKLMERTGKEDVTALPYGINTVSLFAYIFFIMAPAYHKTQDVDFAWRLGLVACFLSGVMETLGAFFCDWLRRHTPRAALLSALGGIAITFISMGFVFQIFASPAIAIIPMMFILIAYGSKIRLPFGLPGGMLAIALGTLIAWGLKLCGWSHFSPTSTPYVFQYYIPEFSITALLQTLQSPEAWSYLSIIFPMGLFNIIGSLQNLESAEAAGDNYETKPSMLANGLGTLIASCFGSPFPTTIYIGHPAWKAMGARSAYSALNGVITFLLCLFGAVTLILKIIPLEVSLGILLWIGIMIVAQCFQEVPKKHALAVAFGFIPSLAAWALILIETALRVAGTDLYNAFKGFAAQSFYIHGVITLNQGFLITAMSFSAILVYIIEKDFFKAALWTVACSLFSAFGLIHAYDLSPGGILYKFGAFVCPELSLSYSFVAIVLFSLHLYQKNSEKL